MIVYKVEDNPAFDLKKADEWEERQQRGPYWEHHETPPDLRREIGTRQVEVVLTEEEYQAVKEAVVEVWD